MLENVQTNYLKVHIACWKQNTAQYTLPYNQMRLIYIYIYIYIKSWLLRMKGLSALSFWRFEICSMSIALVIIFSRHMFRRGPWLWCCSVNRIVGIDLDVAYGIVSLGRPITNAIVMRVSERFTTFPSSYLPIKKRK
jgi:hypothetical protein